MLKAQFTDFARYNRWANGRLYDAAADLSEDEYRRDCGLFFRSMHGTLNHLLTADRIWLRRITGEGEAPDRLDAILFEDRAALRAAREAEDARILRHVESLDEADFAGTFTYRNMRGDSFTQALAPVLSHVFNHQTHHRGQAHALLTGLGRKAPELDLIYFLRTQ